MAIYLPTPGFKGRAFKLCVLTRWDFNFCVRSSTLRGRRRRRKRRRTTTKKKKDVSFYWSRREFQSIINYADVIDQKKQQPKTEREAIIRASPTQAQSSWWRTTRNIFLKERDGKNSTRCGLWLPWDEQIIATAKLMTYGSPHTAAWLHVAFGYGLARRRLDATVA